MNKRSLEDNPGERYQDKGLKARIKNWWGPGRGYRDLWMIAITIVVLAATKANYDNIEITKDNSAATKTLAIRSTNLSKQIQKSRTEAFIYSCEQQNIRGRKAKKRLIQLIKTDPRGSNNFEAKERKYFTSELIKELAPQQDCDYIVKQLVEIP